MEKFECMLESNRITHEILQKCKELILDREAITKEEVAMLAECSMTTHGVIPAFKGIGGFPYSICISVNDEAIHGVADDRKIVKGDLVSLDFGVIYEGYCSDAAISFINDKTISNPISRKRRLVRKTKEALDKSVEALRRTFPKCTVADISKTIEEVGNNYGIVTDFGGHGIGKEVHEKRIFVPNNYEPNRADIDLDIGDFFTIEPMFTLGSGELVQAEDGFTLKTIDGSLSAHFEYSIAITKDGVIILK